MALFVLVVGSEAQIGGKGGKGGGGFGTGGGGGSDPLTLLRRADVKKELELTDERVENLPAVVLKAVGEVLSDKQMTRFRQIDLQKKDTAALKDAKLRKELNISESQVKIMDEIFADSAKEMKEILADAKGGNFKALHLFLHTLEIATLGIRKNFLHLLRGIGENLVHDLDLRFADVQLLAQLGVLQGGCVFFLQVDLAEASHLLVAQHLADRLQHDGGQVFDP